MRFGTRATAVKIFASVVLVGGAASVAALGTYGSFTSTTSASENVSTGKVVLNSAAGVRGLSIDATNLVPGDTVAAHRHPDPQQRHRVVRLGQAHHHRHHQQRADLATPRTACS